MPNRVIRQLSIFELTSEFGSEVAKDLQRQKKTWALFSTLEDAPVTPTFHNAAEVRAFLDGVIHENGDPVAGYCDLT